jgi:hypothetical protein
VTRRFRIPRNGEFVVAELPVDGLIGIVCSRCERKGQYRRETLVAMFGPEMALPDVLIRFAKCPRRGDMSNNCGVHFNGRH